MYINMNLFIYLKTMQAINKEDGSTKTLQTMQNFQEGKHENGND